MNLLDIVTGAWAIEPQKLLEIQAIYAAHLRGDKIDIKAIEASLGRPLANEQKKYRIEPGGVGVLSAIGVMAPRANLFMQVSGGISTGMLTQQINSLHADPSVRTALIHADSPGGNVLGIPAAVDALRALAADKPTVLVGEGTVASAMYWFGSAANAMFIEGSTDQVGSLGVYMRLGWNPKDEHSMELVRGKYKRLSINGEKPDPEVLAHAEGQMDYLYSVLIDGVAQHRGVSADAVLERMAEGRVFIGQQAIKAGLVDGYSTVDAMVERLATKPDEFKQRRKAQFALGELPVPSSGTGDVPPLQAAADPVPVEGQFSTTKGNVMPQADNQTLTRESLERDHTALFATLRAEFTSSGATAERERIQAVLGQSMPGHEKVVQALAWDGKTTGPEAAMAVLKAHREATAGAAADHAADAPAAVKPGNAPAGEGGKTKDQQVAEAKAHAATHKVDFIAAMKALGYAS